MNLEQNRRSLFWLLQKWSSYTVWAHCANQFDVFVKAYEEALASWPDGERPPEYNLRFAYQAQELYQKGLVALSRGDRSVWREREDGYLGLAAGRASKAMQGITSKEINREYGGEHGTPLYSEWTSRLEALRLLKEEAESVGGYLVYERRPMYVDFHPTVVIGAENLSEYLERMTSEDYLGFPPRLGASLGQLPINCPPTPEVSTIVAESGESITKDGIWELVLLHRVPGETDALNYFVKGAMAPWIHDSKYDDPKYECEPDKQYVLPATWRLVWEDKRYLDGVIPDESFYLNPIDKLVSAVETDPTLGPLMAHGRCEGGVSCPRTGYWYTPAKQNSRALFKQGDVMPDFPDSSYGATIWYWDQN